jgi:hypothetical protein
LIVPGHSISSFGGGRQDLGNGQDDLALPWSSCGERVSSGRLCHGEHLLQRKVEASFFEERGRDSETVASIWLASEIAEREADPELRAGEVRNRDD